MLMAQMDRDDPAEDDPDFDEPIADFLRRWPEGFYEFESRSLDGDNYESKVMFYDEAQCPARSVRIASTCDSIASRLVNPK